MPNIRALLLGIRLETPAERNARMDAFHVKHPALTKAAQRHGVQWDDEKEGEWDGVDERIYD